MKRRQLIIKNITSDYVDDYIFLPLLSLFLILFFIIQIEGDEGQRSVAGG